MTTCALWHPCTYTQHMGPTTTWTQIQQIIINPKIRSTYYSCRDLDLVHKCHLVAHIVCDSSFMGSNIFRSPRALHTYNAHAYSHQISKTSFE